MPPPYGDEVRRCSLCGKASAVCVREWATSTWGVRTGTDKREFRCQSCGHGFLVLPKGRATGFFIFAGMMSPIAMISLIGGAIITFQEPRLSTVFGGLILSAIGTGFSGVPLWLALRQRAQESRTAVVPDAPLPELKFPWEPGEERPRRCACGQTAVCKETIARRTNGVPTGTEWHFACAACGRGFATESVWASCFAALASLVLGALAGGLIYAGTPDAEHPIRWPAIGFGVLFALLTVFAASQTAWRIRNRYRFPQAKHAEAADGVA